nr:hypothetical protein [Tanacetum cinerariifolium]
MFDEGGSGNQTEQGDFARGGPDANIQPVVEAAKIVVEDLAPVQSRRKGKIKSVVVDAGGLSHPPKKLRADHGTPCEASVGASVSTTPEREDGDHNTNSMAEPISVLLGIHQAVNPTFVTKEKFVEPSSFGAGSSSAGETDPITGVFSDLTASTTGWMLASGPPLAESPCSVWLPLPPSSNILSTLASSSLSTRSGATGSRGIVRSTVVSINRGSSSFRSRLTTLTLVGFEYATKKSMASKVIHPEEMIVLIFKGIKGFRITYGSIIGTLTK